MSLVEQKHCYVTGMRRLQMTRAYFSAHEWCINFLCLSSKKNLLHYFEQLWEEQNCISHSKRRFPEKYKIIHFNFDKVIKNKFINWVCKKFLLPLRTSIPLVNNLLIITFFEWSNFFKNSSFRRNLSVRFVHFLRWKMCKCKWQASNSSA